MIRRPPRSTQSRSSAASDVYKRQVLLLLEQLVGARRLFERKAMGGKALDTEWIRVVGNQRQDVVDPELDVGLAHTQLNLLVEERQHRQRVGLAPIDADERDGPDPTNELDREVECRQAIHAGLL